MPPKPLRRIFISLISSFFVPFFMQNFSPQLVVPFSCGLTTTGLLPGACGLSGFITGFTVSLSSSQSARLPILSPRLSIIPLSCFFGFPALLAAADGLYKGLLTSSFALDL